MATIQITRNESTGENTVLVTTTRFGGRHTHLSVENIGGVAHVIPCVAVIAASEPESTQTFNIDTDVLEFEGQRYRLDDPSPICYPSLVPA